MNEDDGAFSFDKGIRLNDKDIRASPLRLAFTHDPPRPPHRPPQPQPDDLGLGQDLPRGHDMQVLNDFAIHNSNALPICLRLGKGTDLSLCKFNFGR